MLGTENMSWPGFGQALQSSSPMLLGMAQSLRSGQGIFGSPTQQGLGVMRQKQQRDEDIGLLADLLGGGGMGGGAQTPMASVMSGSDMSPMAQRNAAMSQFGGPSNAAADALSATNAAPSGPDPFGLREVAASAGLPESYLHQMAIKESGMNPGAQNPRSSASGLFQFIDSTARQYGVNNRDSDPSDDIEGILRYTQDSVEALTPVLGRTPNERELYLAHQQGQAGARRLLGNPNARAVDIVGRDAVVLNGGRADMTAQQFANHVMNYYGPNRSGGRAPAPPAAGGNFPVQGEQLGAMARQVTGADYDPQELLARAQAGDTAAQALYEQIVQMGGGDGGAAPGGPADDMLSGGAGDMMARGQQGGDRLSATLSTQGTGGGLSEDEARRLATVLTSPSISPAAQQLLMQRYFPPDQSGYRMLTPAEVQGFGLPEGSYQMGGDGRISAIGGGGVTVNNNMGPTGIDYGEPEAGLVWQRDQQGNVMLDERGAPIAVPYQGGSVYREQQEVEQQADTAEAQTEERRRQERLKLGTTLTSIGLNIAEIEDGGMPVAGRGGDFARTRVGRFLLGNDATDFENRTNQITTSAALSEVQNMRDNSPTGGAVGQLTDGEREAIGNAVTALNSSTSPEEYVRAARAYQDLAINIATKRPDGSSPNWRLVEDEDGNVSVEVMDGPGQAAPAAAPAAEQAAPAAPPAGQAIAAPPMPDAFAQDEGVQQMARSFGMTPAELWSSAGDQEYWDAWLN